MTICLRAVKSPKAGTGPCGSLCLTQGLAGIDAQRILSNMWVRHLRSKTVSQAPHPCPHETRWWTRSHSKTLLLLTYRLTWDSSSGSFVGHVWRGWMPKERDDFAFQRRVCASWLPQDPLVSGSISGPGGWDAVLKQIEMGKGLRTGRWQVHLSPVWNLPPRMACLFRSIKEGPRCPASLHHDLCRAAQGPGSEELLGLGSMWNPTHPSAVITLPIHTSKGSS